MSGISALIEKFPGSSLFLSAMKGYGKLGSGSAPDTGPAVTLTLDFLASRKVRNMLISHFT